MACCGIIVPTVEVKLSCSCSRRTNNDSCGEVSCMTTEGGVTVSLSNIKEEQKQQQVITTNLFNNLLGAGEGTQLTFQ